LRRRWLARHQGGAATPRQGSLSRNWQFHLFDRNWLIDNVPFLFFHASMQEDIHFIRDALLSLVPRVQSQQAW
jgi:hypothetical protein